MKILVGISGASGAHLGVKLANEIAKGANEVVVIITDGAKIAMDKEYDKSRILSKESGDSRILDFSKIFHPKVQIQSEIYESAASGSAGFESMIIAPCSANSLAKIACGISDNLLLRAAAVMLKEKRKLVLAVRELPFSSISLEQMTNLAKIGAIIAPPILAYYSKPQSLEDAENFIIGKWLDALGIENSLFKRWEK